MQLILTKEEYDDLVRRANDMDSQVDQKMQALTEDFKLKITTLVKRHSNDASMFFQELRALLEKY